MYKKTEPQQSLFGVETQLSASLKARLKGSWAESFRVETLTILLKSEDCFSMLYGTTGRPNYSVARVLGLCLLQELYNLSDQQALDTFGFDIRWRYALALLGSNHCKQSNLHYITFKMASHFYLYPFFQR